MVIFSCILRMSLYVFKKCGGVLKLDTLAHWLQIPDQISLIFAGFCGILEWGGYLTRIAQLSGLKVLHRLSMVISELMFK